VQRVIMAMLLAITHRRVSMVAVRWDFRVALTTAAVARARWGAATLVVAQAPGAVALTATQEMAAIPDSVTRTILPNPIISTRAANKSVEAVTMTTAITTTGKRIPATHQKGTANT